MKKARVNPRVLYLTELSVLLAILLLMAFTPIGYIKTAGLEIALITIPVILGATLLDEKAGAILGLAFGITSFIQAVSGLSAFGVLLFQLRPVATFFVCVPTRCLMGWLCGLIFKAFKKKNALAYGVSGLAGALLNTLFFMTTLLAFFWKTDLIQGFATQLGSTNVFAFTIAFVGINGLIEAITCTVLAVALALPLRKAMEKVQG